MGDVQPRPGILYLVGTPIGNLEDLSPRAVRTLGSVSLVAAEDTRRTGLLLGHAGVRPPMVSFHAHNESERVPEILARLEAGKSVAVVSDAGNPGISDPAERLVHAAVERGFEVVPVPGPSAFLVALVASGLPTRSFVFEGYLPSRRAARRQALRSLRAEKRTIVLHESPKRVVALLEDARAELGERRVVLGRELTKKFEEFVRGRVSEVIGRLASDSARGEFVVLIEGAGEEAALPAERVSSIVREEIAAGRSLRDSVRTAARAGGWTEQEIYRLLRGEEI
jgi:16S rRNA (cytidine1402-2'-O)-methyltransferase